jgi:hypothetical protein
MPLVRPSRGDAHPLSRPTHRPLCQECSDLRRIHVKHPSTGAPTPDTDSSATASLNARIIRVKNAPRGRLRLRGYEACVIHLWAAGTSASDLAVQSTTCGVDMRNPSSRPAAAPDTICQGEQPPRARRTGWDESGCPEPGYARNRTAEVGRPCPDSRETSDRPHRDGGQDSARFEPDERHRCSRFSIVPIHPAREDLSR